MRFQWTLIVLCGSVASAPRVLQRIIPGQVDTVARKAPESALASARREIAEARVRERIETEAQKPIDTRILFSPPDEIHASSSRAEFKQGGRVVPIDSLSENRGAVTQNGAAVSVYISRYLVIINGNVLFIKDGFVTYRGEQLTVCGSLIASASKFRCCAGNLYERFDVTSGSTEEIQCCGNVGAFFLPRKEICCSGNFFSMRSHMNETVACCESTFFIPNGEVCCAGSIFLNYPVDEIACCETQPFHNALDACCAGTIVGKETIDPASPCVRSVDQIV